MPETREPESRPDRASTPEIPAPFEPYEAKYAGYSVERLDAAYQGLLASFGTELQPLFEAELEAGRSEEHVIDLDEIDAVRPPNTVLASYRIDDSYADESGKKRLLITTLPRAYYPHAYETNDEITWLARELKRRKE